jgi:hypothetical protein
MSEAKSIFYASSPDAAAWMCLLTYKCNIYVGDQMDCWNELKEVLRVQTRAEVAQILLDR